jgi:hypothetical protein
MNVEQTNPQWNFLMTFPISVFGLEHLLLRLELWVSKLKTNKELL